MKNVLVIENIDHLSDPMNRFVNSELKDFNVDVFTGLINATDEEIIQRVSVVEDIYFESLFQDIDQVYKMLELFKSLSTKMNKRFNLNIMFGHQNSLLKWLNQDLIVQGNKNVIMALVNSLKYVTLNEIRYSTEDVTGSNSYFKKFNYEFDIEPVLFYRELTMFIHKYKLHSPEKYDIKDGDVTIKKVRSSRFDKLSTKDKKTLREVLKEYKAKVEYDLLDKDFILSLEDGQEIVEEKERHGNCYE